MCGCVGLNACGCVCGMRLDIDIFFKAFESTKKLLSSHPRNIVRVTLLKSAYLIIKILSTLNKNGSGDGSVGLPGRNFGLDGNISTIKEASL